MRRLGSLGNRGEGYLYATDPFTVLLVTFGILAGLSLVLVAAPLALTARKQRPPLGSLGFFAAIGLGFLTLEIVLIQRFVLFLGFPTYALSVVLFALLLWTGAGSLLAGRVRDARRALTVSLAAACALIAASAYGLHPLLETADRPALRRPRGDHRRADRPGRHRARHGDAARAEPPGRAAPARRRRGRGA